jgi:methionyl-tRNA synthetase
MTAIIAYTVGSFWYCPTDGITLPDAQPVTEANTLPVYSYHCDSCGKLLMARKESKSILYASTTRLARDYLRASNLNPNSFNIVTQSQLLEQAIHGTTGCRVLVLNGHPIDLNTWGGLRARDAVIEAISH